MIQPILVILVTVSILATTSDILDGGIQHHHCFIRLVTVHMGHLLCLDNLGIHCAKPHSTATFSIESTTSNSIYTDGF